MKIISKFHDYYDGAHGWYSPLPLFVRGENIFSLENLDNDGRKPFEHINNLFTSMPDNHNLSNGIIAFCGKAYPYYQYGDAIGNSYTMYSTREIEKNLKKIIRQSHYDTSKAKEIGSSLHKKAKARFFRGHALCHESWNKWFYESNLEISVEAFIAVHSPIFNISRVGGTTFIIVNPILKGLNFASQVDPFTAYQEIEMYIGNELAVQMDPNVKRTDDEIRDSKGMDKWSFRKHKDDPKRKK
jgi:hypothetical protein